MAQKFEDPGQLESIASVLHGFGKKSGSTEALASDTLNYLYNKLNDGDDNPCALMRFFRTIPFAELTPDLRDIAAASVAKGPAELVNCLTLLATRGIEPQWNERFSSRGHQVIPLVSEEMVQKAPMIAQLIKRLGINISQVVQPNPTLFLHPSEKNYNVLYVPEAKGSSTIVAQSDFVDQYGVRSVIGLGGLLPTGEMFAVMIFFRVFIPASTAERFVLLARGLESAIAEVRSGKRNRARILIACSAEESYRVAKLLGHNHDMVVVNSIEQAVTAASAEIFDLIVCGVSFDESRMFELLRAVKKRSHLKPKPFICFREHRPVWGPAAEQSLKKAAVVAGATTYLNAFELDDKSILDTFEAYLPEEIWIDRYSTPS